MGGWSPYPAGYRNTRCRHPAGAFGANSAGEPRGGRAVSQTASRCRHPGGRTLVADPHVFGQGDEAAPLLTGEAAPRPCAVGEETNFTPFKL